MERLLVFTMIFLHLHRGLTNEVMCGETRHVSSAVGGEVVLPVQQTEVQDITWMTDREKNVFAVTESGKAVTIRSLYYDGRLNVTANGSLIITKVTRGDQGIYKGSVLRRTSGQCAQLYNLTVYVEQVYVSREVTTASPVREVTTASPVRTTAGAKTTKYIKRVTAWILISLCVTGTALLIFIFTVTILVSVFQKTKEKKRAGAGFREAELFYTELDIKCLQKASSRRKDQDQKTVTYSHVKVVKKTNV